MATKQQIFQAMSPTKRGLVPLKGPRSGCIDDIYCTKMGQFVQFDFHTQTWMAITTGVTVVAPLAGKGRPRALKL